MSADDVVASVRAAALAGGLEDAAGDAVALLSGGRDSVCLLHVAVVLLGSARVRALHVNYALRDAAGGDEELCRELCGRLGVELEVTHPARPADATGNLQAWARDVRYATATRLAAERDGLVLTGHTATDQVETILYRLAASPGRRALLGMPQRRGRLLRPLLAVTREQTADYCRAAGLTWREDETNDSDAFARGRVRNGLVPALREVHPAAEANVLRTAALLRDEAAVLDELTAEVLQGSDRVALSALAALAPALARLVLVRLAEDAAGGPAGAVGDRLAELLTLDGRGGTVELHLGGGLRALIEYGVVRVVAGDAQLLPPAIALPVPGRVRFGTWELECVQLPEPPGATDEADGALALLDADALGDALLVRCWRAGDRIAPAGMQGTKTLSDLFVDRRVPRAERASLPLLEAHGAIAWVTGLAVDRRFAMTAQTSRTVAVRARRVTAG